MARLCERCNAPIEPPKTTFCSAACSKRARRSRKQKSPSSRRSSLRYRQRQPFEQFKVRAKKRKPVSEAAADQRVARALIARGAIAYENRQGLIRDVGSPRYREDAGKVFSRAPGSAKPKP